MKRRKFQTRAILIRSSQQVDIAKDIIGKLPVDQEHPIEVVIREHNPARSNSANARYWAMLDDISEQVFVEGKSFSADVWHEYSKEHLMPNLVTNRKGETVPKWIERPDGKKCIISTSDLSGESFSEYMNEVEVFAVEMGVILGTNRA